MLLSQRLVWVKEHSTLAATFLHTAAWGLDWFTEQHPVTQTQFVLSSNSKTQATSVRGLQLTAESRAELTHLNPWRKWAHLQSGLFPAPAMSTVNPEESS